MKKHLIYSVAVTLFSGIAWMGCSSQQEDGSVNNDGTKVLKATFNSPAAEAAYAHKTFLINAMGKIESISAGENAAALQPFVVEPATYSLYAMAANSETNLTISSASVESTVIGARIKVTNMANQIPELLVGKATGIVISDANVSKPITLTRVVASVTVTVKGLEALDAESITLKIGNMYDQIDLDGTLEKSGEEFVSKTLTLTKNSDGKFVGNAIVMPTDPSAAALAFTYNINGKDYSGAPQGGVAAIAKNGQYNLTTTATVQGGNTSFDLSTAITYAPWDSQVNLTDNITIEETTPDKTWTSAALVIGGKPSPDNFWASSGSDGLPDKLFDGVKDENSYWYPESWDMTAPCWYINLGTPKEGVTIDYWNKFGGKGGGKIKTMDIYVSDLAADYSGGNTNWTKIHTFTSDKTAPTTDAGAKLTTGKIEFNNGNTSYQYVKCVITSRVDTSGNTDTNIDINVAEVEVATWSYK